ncbi:glycosyltransferase family 2 protein [Serpens gallinarum]|uniref:Glycosyltransferase family 2 protein n=1 Tax=Serpens gallinarum TaxID=2763075 RepID=A0ABR8TS23_9PSED|nr:glycosyltransferase [Serpens gallinarum]MBD7978572.1 glycosyltransferase family 2 protein [Serpens gallinarum]
MKICVVPVCYNSYDDALRLLESVNRAYKACPNLTLDVILADNSTIPTRQDVSSWQFEYSFRYLRNDNIGYYPAFNRALDTLPHGAEVYDFVVVCNVDLIVADDFFSALLNSSVSNETGLIAPSIISDKDGRDLNPKIMSRPSARKIQFMRLVCSSVTLFRWYQKLSRMRERARSRAQCTHVSSPSLESSNKKLMYGAHGSFMIFTQNYFLKGGHVAYPRFLFGEEVFVAEQLRMHRLNIDHVPTLRVYDKEHASTSQVNLAFICAEHKKSYDYLYSNFYMKNIG